MRVYISGPMRGVPDFNYPAFDAAAERWRAAGHVPFSPAAMDRALGYTAEVGRPTPRGVLQHMMSCDVAAIYASDAVALLPGWEGSAGATVELALAMFLGLEVYDGVTMERAYPDQRPWLSANRVPDDFPVTAAEMATVVRLVSGGSLSEAMLRLREVVSRLERWEAGA